MIVTEGATDVTVPFYFVDDVGGTAPGEPTTGLLFSDIETGGSASYQRQGAARVDFALITLASASAAHADGGFILVDDTEMPGVYRCDIPDAAVAAGVDFVIIYLRAASANNTITRPIKIDLTVVDLRAANGRVDVGQWLGTAVPAPTVAGTPRVEVVAALAAFFQDCFTVNSGEVSGAEVSGSLILETAKVIWDRVLSGATHNIATSAGRRLRGIQTFQGYEDGAIWIDTVNGSAGTTDFENGTVENPVDTIVDANTLAASLGIARFHIAPASSITFAATQANQVFIGEQWTLALGGQSVSGSYFSGADISGIGTGASEIHFEHCHMGAVTLPPSDLEGCILESTFTIGTAGDFFFENCKSGVAGTSTPVLDFGSALNSSNISFRAYSGGIEIQNMGAGTGSYDMSLEGWGQLVINANCSATSAVAIRGHFTVTDNAGGAVTLSDDARIDVAQINAEVDTALVDIKLDHLIAVADGDDPVDGSIIAHLASAIEDWSTFVPSDDSLQAIRDRGDAAWTTGAGTGLTALASGTAQSGTASTIVLASGEAFADNVLNGNIVKITSGTGAGQSRLIISNTLTDDTCNIAPNWATNPSSDSVYEIVDGAANIEAISLDNTAPNNLKLVYDGVEGFAPAYAGPRGPGVYLNDAAANTNTVNGTDGTWANPVSTIAAAKTIADSLSADRIYLINDSSITLAATMEDYEFVGIGEMTVNIVNFGSQDVDNSVFHNLLLTGAQGGTNRCQAEDCVLSTITGMEITALRCLIAAGTLTLRNDCAFDSCFSAVAGSGTPTLDINSVASVNVYFRHYSGGMQIDNAVATTVMSYEADGQLVIDATCTSLTIVVRGNCSITDNGTTTSLTQDAAVNRTNINAEVDTALVDINLDHLMKTAVANNADMTTEVTDGTVLSNIMSKTSDTSTYTVADDSLQAIRDAGFSTITTAQVNAEMVDVMRTDTNSELAQGIPPATPTFEEAVMFLYMALRNKLTVTATEKGIYNDAGTKIAKKTLSDDATTYTETEAVSGA